MSATPPGPPPAPAAPPHPPGPQGPATRAVTCPGCGSAITLRALGQSVMAACPACQSLIDVSRPEIRLIQKYQEVARHLRIPLGARGKLRGQELEVVGAMGRSTMGYHWDEYLLYSPFLGFRWLVCDQGHWNFGKTVKDTTHLRDPAPFYEGNNYRFYQRGTAQVDWVVGEFYWRVQKGDSVDTADYIHPPLMLSRETSKDETVWTQLIYLEPAEVAAAFGIPPTNPVDTAANQPNPYLARLKEASRVVRLALAAALVIQLATCVGVRDARLPLGTYQFTHDPANEEQVFGPVTLRSSHSLNELHAEAGLDNSWVELDCTLVNDASGEVYHFSNAFEFYSGVDSDGSWSEGDRRGSTLLVGIPAGTYHLVVSGSGGRQGGQPQTEPVGLYLQHDVAPWRNFWLAVLFILAYPVFLVFRSAAFEQDRGGEETPLSQLANRVKSLQNP
jgi:hypothetical protein